MHQLCNAMRCFGDAVVQQTSTIATWNLVYFHIPLMHSLGKLRRAAGVVRLLEQLSRIQNLEELLSLHDPGATQHIMTLEQYMCLPTWRTAEEITRIVEGKWSTINCSRTFRREASIAIFCPKHTCKRCSLLEHSSLSHIELVRVLSREAS